MIYFIVFFLMILCVYAYDYRKYTHFYSVSYWGFFVLLVLIAGLRYRIGIDSIVYEDYYDKVPTLASLSNFKFDSTRFEPGFMIFASLTRSISDDFTLLQFSQAIVVNLVIFWFILKNTPHRFLCLSLYFLILYLNLTTQVMREALAVCLFLLAWPFFRDGKWLQYYALCFVAFFFHTSAVLTFLLPLMCIPGIKYFFQFGWRSLFICAGVLILGFVIRNQFYDFFLMLSLTDRMMDRAHEYSKDVQGGGVLNVAGALLVVLKYVLFPMIALYFTKYKWRRLGDEKEEKRFQKLEMLVLICVYLQLLSVPMFIFGRYYNYFSMFTFVLIASCVSSRLYTAKKILKVKPGYWVVAMSIYYFLGFHFYLVPANKSGTLKTYSIYYPYVTRFNPYMDPDREAIFRYYDAR